MKLPLLFLLGMMLIVSVFGDGGDDACDVTGDSRDYEPCRRPFCLDAESKGDSSAACECRKCCNDSDKIDAKRACRSMCGRCDDGDDDDDDDKCSDGSNRDFLDDLNECLDEESADGGGLRCRECERCCRKACEDAEPGCGGASPSACRRRCEDKRCSHVCDSSDDSDSSSRDGRSCSEKIHDCCDCLEDECHVYSGDSADSSNKSCIKEDCKNEFCKDAGKCKYGDRDKWKKVVDRKCNVEW